MADRSTSFVRSFWAKAWRISVVSLWAARLAGSVFRGIVGIAGPRVPELTPVRGVGCSITGLGIWATSSVLVAIVRATTSIRFMCRWLTVGRRAFSGATPALPIYPVYAGKQQPSATGA